MPVRIPEKPEDSEYSDDSNDSEEDIDPDARKSEQQVRDEMTGQLRLFDDEWHNKYKKCTRAIMTEGLFLAQTFGRVNKNA